VAVVTCLRSVATGTPACCATDGMTPDQVATLAVYAVGLLHGNADLMSLLTEDQREQVRAARDQAEETGDQVLAGVCAFLDGQLEMYALESMLDDPAEGISHG
jgi:hypothetical protein